MDLQKKQNHEANRVGIESMVKKKAKGRCISSSSCLLSVNLIQEPVSEVEYNLHVEDPGRDVFQTIFVLKVSRVKQIHQEIWGERENESE